MLKQKLFLSLTFILAFIVLTSNTTFAQNIARESVNCSFTATDTDVISAKFITLRSKLRVEPNEEFRVKVFLQNTGNTPWFSAKSNCKGPTMALGTDKPRDRRSTLYPNTIIEENNWKIVNRITMDQMRVEPGQIASFTFYAKAGKNKDIIKEYFTPLIEGQMWLEDATFSFELFIGNNGDTPKDIRTKLNFANTSGSADNIDLNGEKSLLVDLSEQTVWLKLGDTVIREFPVSTGKSSTPTPPGETTITLKQQVRISHSTPHYIMPKFMMFRAGGYGFHALPSLGNDGGWFWTEARNHIGIPVSHGCIRLLPEDADFLFDFAEVGTKVKVQY